MTAKILKNYSCKDCDWPVIDCCCNGLMSKDEFGDWDWWQYCSNKGCKNHHGEGVFQNTPDWIKKNV